MTADVEQILRDSGQDFSNVAPVKRQKRPDGAIGKPFNSKLLAEAERALAAWKVSPEGEAFLERAKTCNLSEFQLMAHQVLTGPYFQRTLQMTTEEDSGYSLSDIVPKSISLGLMGQVILGIGVAGSIGYAVDLPSITGTAKDLIEDYQDGTISPPTTQLETCIYFGGAVIDGADAGVEADVVVGFWTEATSDIGGFYAGVEVDVADGLGVTAAGLEHKGELAVAFVGVDVGFDDGGEEDNYLFYTVSTSHDPVYQTAEKTYMVLLGDLVCNNSKGNYDGVHLTYTVDGEDTEYRYPAWDKFAMAEEKNDPTYNSWGLGCAIKFDNYFSITLRLDGYNASPVDIYSGHFNNRVDNTNYPFNIDDDIGIGINKISYTVNAKMVKASS